jgi:hypothetical protein
MNDMVVMKFLVACLRLVFISVFYWFLCAGMCDFSSHYTCYSWTELAFCLHVNGDVSGYYCWNFMCWNMKFQQLLLLLRLDKLSLLLAC